jgi:hypothetical protein
MIKVEMVLSSKENAIPRYSTLNVSTQMETRVSRHHPIAFWGEVECFYALSLGFVLGCESLSFGDYALDFLLA